MSALAMAGTASSRNKLMRIDHMGLYPEVRRGDYVIWQEVRGFVQEGLYVVANGDFQNVYQVQNCGGKLALLWPDRDIDPKTRERKPGIEPLEYSLEDFAKFCLGFVVATVKVQHEGAFLGGETLKGRNARAPKRSLVAA
ncbi:hypothetical protein GFGA_1c1235 [Gluconobacter frateurii NBRC 103465]|nr:hypothetical protein GFGA_1c1235 [Gluconobacter frateurii NBRC 103465]